MGAKPNYFLRADSVISKSGYSLRLVLIQIDSRKDNKIKEKTMRNSGVERKDSGVD
jgi:hypothetical protein